MNESLLHVAKRALPLVIAGAALAGCRNTEGVELPLKDPSPLLSQAYKTCELGDDIAAFKATRDGETITTHYPLVVEKNPLIANNPDSGIAYKGLAARMSGDSAQSALFSTPDQFSYDEAAGIVTHTIPAEKLHENGGSLTLQIVALAEENVIGPHHAMSNSCATIVVRDSSVEPTTHTALGGPISQELIVIR